MGTCQYCYSDTTIEEITPVKTFNLKAGPEFNAINFTFTNKPITEASGDCLVFYANHVKQLNETVALSNLHRKTRRKMFEYLNLAEQQAQKNNLKHYFIPISIPRIKYPHIMLVKMQPWDGGSKHNLEMKIYQLTVGYLEIFKLRNIINITIVEFDSLSGIHYSLSFPPIAKSLQQYCSSIKTVDILCNSVESIDYFYRKIRYYKDKNQNFDLPKGQKRLNDNKKNKKKQKNGLKNESFMLF